MANRTVGEAQAMTLAENMSEATHTLRVRAGIVVAFVVLGFVACGGGGSSGTWDGKLGGKDFSSKPYIHQKRGPTGTAQEELDKCKVSWRSVVSLGESTPYLHDEAAHIVTPHGALTIYDAPDVAEADPKFFQGYEVKCSNKQ